MTKLCVGRWKIMTQKWLVCAALANVVQLNKTLNRLELNGNVTNFVNILNFWNNKHVISDKVKDKKNC